MSVQKPKAYKPQTGMFLAIFAGLFLGLFPAPMILCIGSSDVHLAFQTADNCGVTPSGSHVQVSDLGDPYAGEEHEGPKNQTCTDLDLSFTALVVGSSGLPDDFTHFKTSPLDAIFPPSSVERSLAGVAMIASQKDPQVLLTGTNYQRLVIRTSVVIS